MKKILLLITVITLSFNAFSQFQIGLKGGLNLTTLKAAYSTGGLADKVQESWNNNIQSKSGLGLGFVMSVGGSVFRFQPEFVYMQRGTGIKGSSSEFKTNYFDTKLLFNIGGGGERWKIYSQFGPSFNFWLSKGVYDKNGKLVPGTDKWEDGTETTLPNGETASTRDIRFDIGFVLGLEGRIKVGPGWILINPRYEFGVIPQTINDLGADVYSRVNRDISLNTGYLFEF